MATNMNFEIALRNRDAALEHYDHIQREADADGTQAYKDAEWRNRALNQQDEEWEDPQAAYGAAYDATWERLNGPAADAALTQAHEALEPFFEALPVESAPSHPLRKLRNASINLDDDD